ASRAPSKVKESGRLRSIRRPPDARRELISPLHQSGIEKPPPRPPSDAEGATRGSAPALRSPVRAKPRRWRPPLRFGGGSERRRRGSWLPSRAACPDLLEDLHRRLGRLCRVGAEDLQRCRAARGVEPLAAAI